MQTLLPLTPQVRARRGRPMMHGANNLQKVS